MTEQEKLIQRLTAELLKHVEGTVEIKDYLDILHVKIKRSYNDVIFCYELSTRLLTSYQKYGYVDTIVKDILHCYKSEIMKRYFKESVH